MKVTPTTGSIIAGLSLALFLFLLFIAFSGEARAHGPHDHDYGGTNVTEVTDISYYSSSSLSDSDIADIVSGSLAGGAHQFDWSTTRWQISVTGATTTGDFDEDVNFSFAVGKRWGKDAWAPNALWHVGFTPDIQDEDYIMGGATIVLD
jgi:hypothetical protein